MFYPVVYYPHQRQCPPNTRPYVIRAGDNFYRLAIRFNTTVGAIISANPGVNPNALRVGQVICIPGQQIFPSCPEGNFYRVRRGDTLFSIARRFNVSVDDLIEANPGIEPEFIRVGQIICIPVATPPRRCPPGTFRYRVNRGDTFYSIARRYNTTVRQLIRVNPGVNPFALLVGQVICVPRRRR